MARGCGSAGRAVASDTRDQQFESQYRQSLIHYVYFRAEKTKIKKKMCGKAHLQKTDQLNGKLANTRLF